MRSFLIAHPLVAALLATGIWSDAHAVRIDADGSGDALVFPYFTTRGDWEARGNGYVALVSVLNPTQRGKALKVRFFEGKGGMPILSFNLFLAQYDVWTAGIVPAGTGAGIFTADRSCTTPTLRTKTAQNPERFRNTAYVGDGAGDDLDRTREGYFEILEMATIQPGSALEKSITHEPDFSAPNASKPACTGMPTGDEAPIALLKPSGQLRGSTSLINVYAGTDFSIDAIALSQWSDKIQWSPPESNGPTLGDASPPVSFVVDRTESGDFAYLTTWARGRDAVSALFMIDSISGDYTNERSIGAATDWIFTAPTKRLYVSTTGAEPPFESPFTANGSCDSVGDENEVGLGVIYFDREGQTPGRFLCGSPAECTAKRMCYVANVASFQPLAAHGSTVFRVFDSVNHRDVPSPASQWTRGHASLSMSPFSSAGIHRLIAPSGATTVIALDGSFIRPNVTATYFGLPVVGFAAQSYSNGTLTGARGELLLSNYGAVFQQRYRRRIEATQ